MTLLHRARVLAQSLGIDVTRFEPRTQAEIRLKDILNDLGVLHVIDVGANVGQFGAMVRGPLAFSGRIDSFEPGAGAFAELRDRAGADPRWFVHQVALTEVAGLLTLSVFGESDLSSLSTPSTEGREAWHAEWRADQETVRGERLDNMGLPNLGKVLLKIDTQGHDWSVIESARGVLDRVVVLMSELSFVTLYESSLPASDVISRLDAMGFTLALLLPVNQVVGKQYLLEADGVFVRRDL